MGVVRALPFCARRARGLPGLAMAAQLAMLAASPAAAVTTTYTDPAVFAGALPGPAQTVDFDSMAGGDTVMPFQVLPDGGIAYFVGLVATDRFSSGQVDFTADGEINFAFNVDDVTTAVPEPNPIGLVGLGLIVLGIQGRSRRLRKRRIFR